MIFLTQADLLKNIDQHQLDAAVKGNAARYDAAEQYAIGIIRSTIGGKYDCDAVFSATGTSRHALIVEFCVSITIWHLLSKGLNPRNLPEIRKEDHDQAITLLGKMTSDKSNPGLPLLNSCVKSGVIRLGGKKKVSARW